MGCQASKKLNEELIKEKFDMEKKHKLIIDDLQTNVKMELEKIELTTELDTWNEMTNAIKDGKIEINYDYDGDNKIKSVDNGGEVSSSICTSTNEDVIKTSHKTYIALQDFMKVQFEEKVKSIQTKYDELENRVLIMTAKEKEIREKQQQNNNNNENEMEMMKKENNMLRYKNNILTEMVALEQSANKNATLKINAMKWELLVHGFTKEKMRSMTTVDRRKRISKENPMIAAELSGIEALLEKIEDSKAEEFLKFVIEKWYEENPIKHKKTRRKSKRSLSKSQSQSQEFTADNNNNNNNNMNDHGNSPTSLSSSSSTSLSLSISPKQTRQHCKKPSASAFASSCTSPSSKAKSLTPPITPTNFDKMNNNNNNNNSKFFEIPINHEKFDIIDMEEVEELNININSQLPIDKNFQFKNQDFAKTLTDTMSSMAKTVLVKGSNNSEEGNPLAKTIGDLSTSASASASLSISASSSSSPTMKEYEDVVPAF